MEQYFNQHPEQIYTTLKRQRQKEKIFYQGKTYYIFPGVFPSQQFRSTKLLSQIIPKISTNGSLCDMGCGFGIVGIQALSLGAKYCCFVDINPKAIQNTKKNLQIHHFREDTFSLHVSDCFEQVPKQTFDFIIFNPPFHESKSISHTKSTGLDRAIFDPNGKSIQKFLEQAKQYMNTKSKIFFVYSNKGNVQTLENKFCEQNYSWKICIQTNTDQQYDNRIYELKI